MMAKEKKEKGFVVVPCWFVGVSTSFFSFLPSHQTHHAHHTQTSEK